MTRTNRIFRDKTKWNKPIHENLCSRVIRVPFYSNMEQSSLRKSYLLLLALTLIYDLLFTLPPILLHFGIDADLIYKCFQPVCHQMEARSFHIFGHKLAVCSRCASIYYGLTIGIASYPLFKSLDNVTMPNLTYIMIPFAVLVADFSTNFLGITHNTFVTRSITGGFLGVSTAFFLVPVWISLLKEIQGNPSLPTSLNAHHISYPFISHEARKEDTDGAK